MNGRQSHETARALRKLCAIEFEADPDTEVGKVQRSHLDPSTWFFHVYVMRSDASGGRHVIRSNIIVISDSAASVTGPDEQIIASVLKSPIL